MRPGAAEIWFNELDRLAKLYKERCQECQTILERLSKIKVSAQKSDKDKDKELLKEKDGLLKDLQAHREKDCKQVRELLTSSSWL